MVGKDRSGNIYYRKPEKVGGGGLFLASGTLCQRIPSVCASRMSVKLRNFQKCGRIISFCDEVAR